MMTREDAIMELKRLQSEDDTERAHIDSDGVLCDLLTALGYGDVVAEYEKVDKWFA